MTQEEGSAYIERLCSIIACEIAPTDGHPVEEAVYDIWKPMVAIDGILANQMIEPIKDLWHLHIDDRSLETKGMIGWLEFLDRDCDSKLVSALQRFIDGCHISQEELGSIAGIELLLVRLAFVLNDIASWEEDFEAERNDDASGTLSCNLVQVLSDELHVSSECAKNVLSDICQGWAEKVDDLVVGRIEEGCSDSLREHLNSIAAQMCESELEDSY